MAKSKSSSKSTKVAAPAPALNGVKAGRVTKPAEDSKKKSKDTAKATAKAVEKASSKKRKDSHKSSESDSEGTSDSSASSAGDSDDDMSVDEAPAKVTKAKKASKAAEPESDSSESESDSEVEAPAPKTNGAAKKAAAKDDSSEESSDESEEEAKPVANGKVNKKAAAAADSDDSEADSEDDSSEDDAADEKAAQADSDADSDSSESESDEEEAKPAATEQKKRKADSDFATPVKRTKHNGEPLSEPTKNLFVGSLSWNVDEDWLYREFESFGPASVRVITRPEDGKSKGFGYVEFNTIEEATAALDAKQGAEVDGRNLNIDFGKVRPDRSYNNDQVQDRAAKFGDRAPNAPSSTLFVGNISFNADQDTITEAFSEHGNVLGVRLPTDPDSGNMKGFGYVEFGSIDEAQTAMNALNGADIAGRNIRLDFAGARPAQGDSPRGGRGRGGFGDRGRGRGGFGGGRGRGGFGDRGGRGGGRGGRGGSTNRGGFGDFKGKKMTF